MAQPCNGCDVYSSVTRAAAGQQQRVGHASAGAQEQQRGWDSCRRKGQLLGGWSQWCPTFLRTGGGWQLWPMHSRTEAQVR
eukprot:scaffold114852_cov20-Tisochrysis_lutea.AAC.4